MNRRDVLPGLPEAERAPRKAPDLHIELDPADHEEPTWEVHRPGAPRRRFDRRAQMILAAAAIAAVLANAGAAWAYWRWNGPGEAQQSAAGTAFELALTGSTDQRLRAGETGDLTVTVTNQHAVPMRITLIKRGAGAVAADETHRESGCAAPPVEIRQESFPVSWEVPKNTIGAFVLEDAVTVRPGGAAACRGATYSVPVQARAER